MLKILAHDVVNDVALIQTSSGFATRYGLQDFYYAQYHALQIGLTD